MRSPFVFRSVAEARPGPLWQALFRELWPHYQRWFQRDGDAARPTYLECRRALTRWLPDMVPLWEELVDLAGGGDQAARFLSLYRPPPYIVGCSQAAWPGDPPMLVRNYDYSPRLFEGVVLRSEWTGMPTVAMTDGLIGALDGVNGAGLCVSLSFGGRRLAGEGFGAPLLVRYLLERCDSVAAAAAELERVPAYMAYNFLLLDKAGEFATVFVRPDAPASVRKVALSTNHQEEVVWLTHARATATLERERHLTKQLAKPRLGASDFAADFLRKPLWSGEYRRGFGTLYTAIYHPRVGTVEYRWPQASLHQSLAQFTPGTFPVRWSSVNESRQAAAATSLGPR